MRALVFLLLAGLLAVARGAEPTASDALPDKASDKTTEKATEKAPGALRLDLLKRPRELGHAAEAFGTRSWVVVPKPAPAPPVVVEAPRAPPLPFRYMGQVDDGRGNRTYFLLRGTAPLSVAVGETIDNTYRLESAETGVLHFTYLPLRTRQSFQFGVGP